MDRLADGGEEQRSFAIVDKWPQQSLVCVVFVLCVLPPLLRCSLTFTSPSEALITTYGSLAHFARVEPHSVPFGLPVF